jgi:lysophospholipase L1-like esterase
MRATLIFLSTLVGVGAAAWGHAASSGWAFYGGVIVLIAAFGPGAFAAGRGRWPAAVMRTCSASALVLLVFVGIELTWSVAAAVPRAEEELPMKWAWSYAEARANPRQFRRWWNAVLANFHGVPVHMPDPSGRNPYVLKPGSEMMAGDCRVRINSLGFRGPEISRDKGSAYRIVALGESTVFGATVLATDRPWPEVLEERIRTELSCDARVEVVNAGVSGWTLGNQLSRLDADIVPLDPDLVVTYHGYNGFQYFFEELPGMLVERAPAAVERPSRLLARAENVLTQRRFLQRYERARERAKSVPNVDIEGSVYARLYRDLASRLNAHRIALAVATFNMAVNADSPEDVVQFYEQTFPDIRLRIFANRLHTKLVREIPLGPGVVTIDTSDGLDGKYAEVYSDVVHFNQEGRDRMARNILRGLLPILASDPRLRCQPRQGVEHTGSALGR